MSVRTVRLDAETEGALQEVVEATGLSTSAALKQGVLALRHRLFCQPNALPYDVYAALDLGPGGATPVPRPPRPAVASRKPLGRSWGGDPG